MSTSPGHGGKRKGAGRPTNVSRQIALLKEITSQETSLMTKEAVKAELDRGMTESYIVLARAMPLIMADLVNRAARDERIAKFLAGLFMKMPPPPKDEDEADPWRNAMKSGGTLTQAGVVIHGNATFTPGANAPGTVGSVVDGECRAIPDSLSPGPD